MSKQPAGRKCSAERTGLTGCQAPPQWSIEASNGEKLDACGRHLHRVSISLIRDDGKPLTIRALNVEVLLGVFIQDPNA